MKTRILAVLNQKGGVGKTTTCVNLGAALARRGKRVLLVDMDPQANLTVHVGLEPPRLPRTTYSLLLGQHGLAEAIHPTGVPGLSVVPSTLALANAEIQLASTVGRELVLREALEGWLHPGDAAETPTFGHPVQRPQNAATSPTATSPTATPHAADQAIAANGEDGNGVDDGAADGGGADSGPVADFVIIDCPPSLGTLTMNALCAAGEVLLPIQTEFFALQGVAGILESIKAVQRLNRSLRLSTVVPSMVDRRTTLARDVIEEVRAYFPTITTRTEIRKNVKLAEAPSHGKTIFEWDARCNGAQDYDALAAELLGELPDDPEPNGLTPEKASTKASETAPDTEAEGSADESAATDRPESNTASGSEVAGSDPVRDNTNGESDAEQEPRPASGISLPAEYAEPALPSAANAALESAETDSANSGRPEPGTAEPGTADVAPAPSRSDLPEPRSEPTTPRFATADSEPPQPQIAESHADEPHASTTDPTGSAPETPVVTPAVSTTTAGSATAPPQATLPPATLRAEVPQVTREPDQARAQPDRPWWRSLRRS